MKKTLFVLLIICFGVQSSIAQQVSVDHNGMLIHYRILSTIEKTAAVTFGTEFGAYSGDVVIPATTSYNHESYKVTRIDIYAFYNCDRMTSIELPQTISTIGEFAFYGCSGLKTITIPEQVKVIENNTFANCKQLTSVKLPTQLTKIGKGAFEGCKNLTTMVIPETATDIDETAFAKCNRLNSDSSEPEVLPQSEPEKVEEVRYYMSVQLNNGSMGMVKGEGEYLKGSNIEISATPNSGYQFKEWSDGNSENPRMITLSRDTLMMAMFEKIPQPSMHHMMLKINNSQMGSVIGEGDYRHGTTIKISAIPNEGYKFMEWDDGNNENPRMIVMSQDSLLMANFVRDDSITEMMRKMIEESVAKHRYITLTKNDYDMGKVIGSGRYEVGEYVEISAIPNEGYAFQKWNDGNTDNPRTLLVKYDSVLMAKFVKTKSAPIAYTVTLVSSDTTMGKVEGKGIYRKGTRVSIEALAEEDCEFEEWSDGNSENPRNIEVMQDTFLKAKFSRKSHAPSVLEENNVVENNVIKEEVVATTVVAEEISKSSEESKEEINEEVDTEITESMVVEEELSVEEVPEKVSNEENLNVSEEVVEITQEEVPLKEENNSEVSESMIVENAISEEENSEEKIEEEITLPTMVEAIVQSEETVEEIPNVEEPEMVVEEEKVKLPVVVEAIVQSESTVEIPEEEEQKTVEVEPEVVEENSEVIEAEDVEIPVMVETIIHSEEEEETPKVEEPKAVVEEVKEEPSVVVTEKEETPSVVMSEPEEEKEFDVELTYDPYNDIVEISAEEVYWVKVYNSVHKKIGYYEKQREISFSSFPRGQYLLLMSLPEGKYLRRVVKE